MYAIRSYYVAKLISLLALAAREGRVLPMAWNMPEQVNTTPTATKLNEMMCRNSAPAAMTGSSSVKNAMNNPGFSWHIRVSSSMMLLVITSYSIHYTKLYENRYELRY